MGAKFEIWSEQMELQKSVIQTYTQTDNIGKILYRFFILFFQCLYEWFHYPCVGIITFGAILDTFTDSKI